MSAVHFTGDSNNPRRASEGFHPDSTEPTSQPRDQDYLLDSSVGASFPASSGDRPNVSGGPVEDSLLGKLPNVFCLLHLYPEISSGGLGKYLYGRWCISRLNSSVCAVEKVLIDQDSMRRYLNDISPGSYSSVSKIAFKILDQVRLELLLRQNLTTSYHSSPSSPSESMDVNPKSSNFYEAWIV
jgi:hypothetical protein